MHTVPTPNMTGTITSSTRYSSKRRLLSFLSLTMLLMVVFISCIWRKPYVKRPKLQMQSPTNCIVFFRRNASYERASSYSRANMKRPRNDWRRSGPSVLPSSSRLFHRLIRIQLGCYQSSPRLNVFRDSVNSKTYLSIATVRTVSVTTVAANNRVHSELGTYSRGRLWFGALWE